MSKTLIIFLAFLLPSLAFAQKKVKLNHADSLKGSAKDG